MKLLPPQESNQHFSLTFRLFFATHKPQGPVDIIVEDTNPAQVHVADLDDSFVMSLRRVSSVSSISWRRGNPGRWYQYQLSRQCIEASIRVSTHRTHPELTIMRLRLSTMFSRHVFHCTLWFPSIYPRRNWRSNPEFEARCEYISRYLSVNQPASREEAVPRIC